MSEEHEFGSIEASANRLAMILDKATLNQLPLYSDIYMYASEENGGYIDTICNQATQQAVSYCTFQSNIEIDGEFQALFNIEDFYEIFDLVRGDGTMSLEFSGDESRTLPSHYDIEGDLRGRVHVQSSESDLEHVARGISSMFNEDEEFTPEKEENQIVTWIRADTSATDKIVQAKNSDSFDIDHYPLSVRDGKFFLSLSDENDRNSAEGVLNASEVEGEDMLNEYGQGFESIFNSLSGEVEIQTGPDRPMVVVQSAGDGNDIYRHMLMPAN